MFINNKKDAESALLIKFALTRFKMTAQTRLKPTKDWVLPLMPRNYQQCAEILFDLGLCKVRVMSNNPDKIKALQDAGMQIIERVPIEVEAKEPAAHYLRTKKEKLGHLLKFSE